MTKVRDIAAFLGKTEAFNTTNKRLAFDSSEVSTLTPTTTNDIINQYGVVVYSTVDSLPASPNDGDRAWVTGNNRFYIADSSWHNSLLVNAPPSIDILNYDSDLNDSQSLSMTIQVTDSFENLDIITYNAVISPSNILDSAVLSFSFDSSVVDMAMRSNTIDGVRNFQVTFTANDQVNISSTVKDFAVSPPFSTGTLVSSVSNVDEGSSVTFTLPTVGYANGYTFPYTITGISAADLSPASLSGNMTVSGGSSATVTITATSDNTTEGAETMTFSADGQTVDVIINDTSLSPPSYSITNSYTSVNEGGFQYINIVYANHAGGTISCSVIPTSGVGTINTIGASSNCTVSSVNLSAGTFNLALTGQSGTASMYVRHGNDNARNGTGTGRVTFGSPISANSPTWTVNDTDWPYCGMLLPTTGTSGYDSFIFRFHRDGISGYQYGKASNYAYGSNTTGGFQNGGQQASGQTNVYIRYWKTMIFKLGSTDVGYFTWNSPNRIGLATNSSGLVYNYYAQNYDNFGNLNPTSSGGWSTDLGSGTNSSDVYGGTNQASWFFDTLAFHSSNYSSAASYNKYNEFYLFDAV